MAIASSGQLCFSQLQSEFGGNNPICLSEYYRNGIYVPGTESVSTGATELYRPLIAPYPNDPSNLVGEFLAYFTTERSGSKWQALVGWWGPPLYANFVQVGSPQLPLSLTFTGAVLWILQTGFIFNSEPTSFTSLGFIGNGLPSTTCTYYRGSRKPEIFPGAETSGGTAGQGSFQNAIYIDYEGVRYPSGSSRDPASGQYYVFDPSFDSRILQIGLNLILWPSGYYFYSSSSSVADNRGVVWNGIYVGQPPLNSTSWTYAGYTYFRSGTQQASIGSGTNTLEFFGVYRTGGGSSSTTNINTGVPTSGQVCLSNFRGAYKP